MMDNYRIVVNAVVGGTPPNQVFEYQGLRVTPNVYTTLDEIDTFVDAIQDLLKNGLPAPAAGRG
jgi:selenocysteine lyase/cysteine desulfurase